MASKPNPDVKFQCTVRDGDFHVGDGRVLLGPRTVKNEDGDSEKVDGDIATIPEDVANLGVAKDLGIIVK